MSWIDIKGRDAFSATALGGTAAGGNWDEGTWNVNVAGSGLAMQGAGSSPLLIAALCVGVAWFLLRRK